MQYSNVLLLIKCFLKVTALVDLLPSSQEDCCDFTSAVWKCAVEELSKSMQECTVV